MRNIRDSRRRRSGTWTSRDGRDPAGQTGTDLATILEIPGGRAQLLLEQEDQGDQEVQEDITWLPGNFIQTSTDIQVEDPDHLVLR